MRSTTRTAAGAGSSRSLATGDQGLADTGKEIERAGGSVKGFGGKMDILTARLRQIVPVMRGISAVLS